MIVTDTNTIAYLYLPSNYTNDVEKLLQADPHWIAPSLRRSEFRNILTRYIRNDYITLNEAVEIQDQAEGIFSNNEYSLSSIDVLKIAIESGCSAYDSEFVCLAKNTQAKLITADKKILRAFPDIASTAKNFLAQAA